MLYQESDLESELDILQSSSLRSINTEAIDPTERWKGLRIRISIIASITALFASICSFSYLPGIPETKENLDATTLEIILSLIGPNIVLALVPLFVGPLSDRYGRRIIVVLLIGYLGALFVCTGAFNIWILVVGRTIVFIFGCGFTSISTAIVAEIFPASKRATAISLLLLPSLISAIIVPPISGVLVDFFGWRATFWALIILVFPSIFLVYFFLPETHLNKQKNGMNPFTTIATLKVFPLSGVMLCNALTFVAMAMVSTVFPLIISKYYSYSTSIIGLMFIPYGVGCVLGAIVGGRVADRFQKKKGVGGLILVHIISSCITGAAILLFAWTIPFNPILASFAAMFVSFGGISSRGPVFSLGVQCNPTSAAAATAALVCLQFLLTAPALLLTGFLLERWLPGEIYSIWVGFIVITMPLSIYTCCRYWNRKINYTKVNG